MPDPRDSQTIAIEDLTPELDGGRFPVKSTVGEAIPVEADAFSEGSDPVTVRLLWRPESQTEWNEAPAEPVAPDRFRGAFTPLEPGRWTYTLAAGGESGRAPVLYPERSVRVEAPSARFRSWYELLPGTDRQRQAWLPLVAEMGFDVVCLGELDPWPESRRLIQTVRRHGLEAAVDLAPDGRDPRGLVEFWVRHGVAAFRVSAPGGVPFPLWEALLAAHPEVTFLAWSPERPKVRNRLAKLGFQQTRVELPWSGTTTEARRLFTDLSAARSFLRPCLWPNPSEHPMPPVEAGGRPLFAERLILAATLAAAYGLHALRPWDLEAGSSLGELIALVNRLRKECPALQSDATLCFHGTDNERILCYSKTAAQEALLMAVNLDPDAEQSGWLSLDLSRLGLSPEESFQVHDLLTGARYRWHGSRNFVRLDPHQVPAHVFRVVRAVPQGPG